MRRTAVSSSYIASVGYDPHTSTLEIEFNNGKIFQYADVPSDVATALENAPSVGKAFYASIKGAYPVYRGY